MTYPENPLRSSQTLSIKEGGMAHVYITKNEKLSSNIFAVKSLKPKYYNIESVSESFLKECFIWMTLNTHPNIVEAKTAHYVKPEPPFVILEFVEYSLRELLYRGKIDEEESFRWLVNICDGLIYISKSIPYFIHRDLKPENILISSERIAKVTDFGISIIKEKIKNTSTAGTLMYMAPEQIKGEPLSKKSDIYAFGCLMYELLAGRPVFGFPSNVTQDEYKEHHLNTVPRSILAYRKDLSENVDKIIMKCLQKNPEDRYEDFISIKYDILEIIENELGFKIENRIPIKKISYEKLVNSCYGLSNIGFHNEAISRIDSQINNYNDDKRIQLFIVKARINNGIKNYIDAKKILDKIDPNLTGVSLIEYLLEKGRSEYGLGNLENAYNDFKRVTEIAPEQGMGWNNLAFILKELKQYDKAIEIYKKAISVSANYGFAADLAKLLWEIKKDFEGALNVLRRAILDHPQLYHPYIKFANYASIYLGEAISKGRISLDLLNEFEYTLTKAIQLGAPQKEILDLEEIYLLIKKFKPN